MCVARGTSRHGHICTLRIPKAVYRQTTGMGIIMKTLIAAATIASALTVTAPLAAATMAPHRSDMSCEEFLTLDNVTRPKVVYCAEGVKTKGKPNDAVIDITSIDQLVPIVVEQCRAEPHASLWDKLDTSWNILETTVRKHL